MMKFSSILIVLVVACYFGFFIFMENDPKPSKNTVTSVTKEMPSKSPSFQKATNQKWPFITANSELGALSEALVQKNYVMIFDGSGSMGESGCSGTRSKIDVAKEVVVDWAGSVPDSANLGLIVFDQRGFSIRLPLGIKNREQFIKEIAKITAEYKTPLTQSLDTAYEMLTQQGRKQLGYGEYNVIIVTDGIANNVDALGESVEGVLSQSPIMINTIGFCIDGSHSLNNIGRTVYKAANNPDELRQGLQEVLAESKNFDLTGFE